MLLLQAQKLRPKLAFFLLRHRRLGRAAAWLDMSRSLCLGVTQELPLGRAVNLKLPERLPHARPATSNRKRRQNHIFANVPRLSRVMSEDLRLCIMNGGGEHQSLIVSYYGLLRFIEYPTSLARHRAQRGFSLCGKRSNLASGHISVASYCTHGFARTGSEALDARR